MSTAAEKLKKLRKENGYTQKEVSNYLEISQSRLSQIENGKINFNMTILNKLCLLYDCSPEYLEGKTDFYQKPDIAFHCEGKGDLNAIAKMHQVKGFLKLLRKLESMN